MENIFKKYKLKCSVRGCTTKVKEKVPYHKFPKRGCFGTNWLEACDNEDLLGLDYAIITGNKFFICQRHFTDNSCYAKRNGVLLLKHGTIPTLNLPEALQERDVNIDLPAEDNETLFLNIQPVMYSPPVGKISISSFNLENPEKEISGFPQGHRRVIVKSLNKFTPLIVEKPQLVLEFIDLLDEDPENLYDQENEKNYFDQTLDLNTK